jgi:voltage-gated potassium channel
MNSPPVSATRRQLWIELYEKKTSNLLSFLAFIYLITYSVQSIWYQPGVTWWTLLDLFGKFLWVLFAADLMFRFFMVRPKKRFFRTNWLDTITVVLPQFRALRALRAFSSGGFLSKTGFLSGGAMAAAALGVVVVVWVGGLMVLNAERGASGAEINSLGDAVWWGFETITTVGYGDFVPVTAQGRIYAVMVMFAGISVLGVVSAGMAATLVKKSSNQVPQESPDQDVLDQLNELKAMLAKLEAKVDGQGTS